MKIIKIKEDVFKTEPVIIYDCEYKEFCKWVNKRYCDYKPDDDPGIGTLLTLKNKEDNAKGRIIWVKKLNRTSKSISLLLHELFHLVVRVMADKGVIIADRVSGNLESANGDETAAYLFECYSKQVLDELIKV